MDNPAMLILLPPVLRNRKDVLFGNMPEIYDFHNKYAAALLQTGPLSCWGTKPHFAVLLSFLPSLAEFSCTVWRTAWEPPREWDAVS